MKPIGLALAALAVTTVHAEAGGIDRSTLPYALLFEKGSVAELGFSGVSPNVSGSLATLGGPLATGDMAESYTTLTFAFKADINDRLAYAIIVNQPYGADSNYKSGAYTGLEAHWSSEQVAALLKYRPSDAVSVYGGLRYERSSANIVIPPQMMGGSVYTAKAAADGQIGYVLGAAYEIPKIALRAGITYESALTHKFSTTEVFAPLGPIPTSTTTIVIPQSLAFDFQTGIAANTLLFGSARWSEWSKWQVTPAAYSQLPFPLGGRITGFDHNVMTYQLGIGRKLNDQFSVFARVSYEKANNDTASRLSPTDGMKSIGVGGTWTHDNMKVTGGLEYVKLGDAVDASGTRFSGNHAVGLGMKVDFAF
ncbi:MAG: outer membrane protein transport protein [Paracoccaceae bacterium]